MFVQQSSSLTSQSQSVPGLATQNQWDVASPSPSLSLEGLASGPGGLAQLFVMYTTTVSGF